MAVLKYGRAFDFPSFMETMEKAAIGYNVPVVSLIAMKGRNAFRILIPAILSARTKDDVTEPASRRLLDKAGTPEKLASLTIAEIEKLIYPVGFYKTKAVHLRRAAHMLLEEFGGMVPDSLENLLRIPGVGRKTANLVLGEAFRKNAICVDTHVHRISNRLGLIRTRTPYKTELALAQILPVKYWITYNTFLVAHGQAVCRPISPLCSKCAVAGFCRRAGVWNSR